MASRSLEKRMCLALVCVSAGTLQACNARPALELEPEPVAQQRAAQAFSSGKVPLINLDMEARAEGFVPFSPLPPTPPSAPPRCDQVLNYGTWSLPEQGTRAFSVPLEGSICELARGVTPPTLRYAADLPFLSSNPNYQVPGTTGRSLQFTLPPRTETQGPDGTPYVGYLDRTELVAYEEGFEGLEGVGFNMNNPKYFGFHVLFLLPGQLMVDPNRDTSEGHEGDEGIHIMQAKQLVAWDENHCSVPLSTVIDNNPQFVPGSTKPDEKFPLKWHVSTHRNDGGAYATGLTQGGELKGTWPFEANTWHSFIFYLEPQSTNTPGDGSNHGDGAVKVWFDGVRVIDWVGKWGCNTDPAISPERDRWHLRVGMYRTGPGVINQTLYAFFDNVRVASSKTQADPTIPLP